MIKKTLLSIIFITAIALSFSAGLVNASPSATVFSSAKNLSVENILKVHYPGRRRSCAYWRDRCGYHHSYADYDWCLRDRGCGRYQKPRPHRPYKKYKPHYGKHYSPRPRYSRKKYRCRIIHKKCVRTWGRDNPDYFGCMRYDGCLLKKRYRRY